MKLLGKILYWLDFTFWYVVSIVYHPKGFFKAVFRGVAKLLSKIGNKIREQEKDRQNTLKWLIKRHEYPKK